jgi:drug/metabolite transporter (DMT)-like permease
MLALIGIVLCATSFAVQYGVTHLSANRAVLLFLFELVVAAFFSYLLANEAMGLRDWIGAAMIISATLLSGKLNSDQSVGLTDLAIARPVTKCED